MYHGFILALLVVLSGCQTVTPEGSDSFMDNHYVLGEKDASILVGPFRMKQVLSPICILVDNPFQQQSSRVFLRGCKVAGQKAMDFKAIKTLGTMWPEDVYLRKDSLVQEGSNVFRSVVYEPANQIYIGKDKDGRSQYNTLTYTMPQLLMITQGYCTLDHSDTNYPLYKVFVEAENLAKKSRKGYWASHY